MTERITNYIPHRVPMIMVDELVEVSEAKAVSHFLVREENIFVSDGKFQESGLIENMAQTAAAQAGYFQKKNSRPVLIGYLASVKSFNLFFLPAVNSNLTTSIEVTNQVGDITLLKGEVHLDDHLICSCELRIFVQQNTEANS
jgi:predicted hotdog family 3-hydroxylacyl-ACP dehydratase